MKKFLIIGNMNAVTCKEIFPLFKENKMWLGIPFAAGNAYFSVNEVNNYADGVYDENTGLVKFRNCHWFTNLEHNKRHSPITLTQSYSPDKYPKYDNYDAINVDKVCDIPLDYNGAMGVPVSFLDKYCTEQFEIVDARDYALKEELKHKNTYLVKDADGSINGKPKYSRILIRFKK